ncbi:TSUP family transporter [Salmonella enterica]|nr:TSUP family transporter [Salmonella enterica]
MVWLTGLIIGVLMGLTGAGGGILAVPALMFILDLPITKASPLALIAVSTAAVIGTCIRDNNVSLIQQGYSGPLKRNLLKVSVVIPV